MRVKLICESCKASRHYIWDDHTLPDPSKAYKEGWRSVKGKVYCPLCMAALDLREDYDSEDVFWKKLYEQIPARRPQKGKK